MSRPSNFFLDAVIYWTIRTYDENGELVDADSTPTVVTYKNGVATGESVTVTKRSATTGIYDCSYNPAGEAQGQIYTIEESVTISSTTYENNWSCVPIQYMRGTNSASTHDAAAVVTAMQAAANDFKADVSGLATASALATVDSNVDAILVDTGTTLPATLATIASYIDTEIATLTSNLATVDGIVDSILVDTGTTIPASLTSIQNDIGNVGGIPGSGAISETVTIDDGTDPIPGVGVWVTTDEEGSNVVAGTLVTDANGQVTFQLDEGTYYVWKQLAGYEFTNPQTMTVS